MVQLGQGLARRVAGGVGSRDLGTAHGVGDGVWHGRVALAEADLGFLLEVLATSEALGVVVEVFNLVNGEAVDSGNRCAPLAVTSGVYKARTVRVGLGSHVGEFSLGAADVLANGECGAQVVLVVLFKLEARDATLGRERFAAVPRIDLDGGTGPVRVGRTASVWELTGRAADDLRDLQGAAKFTAAVVLGKLALCDAAAFSHCIAALAGEHLGGLALCTNRECMARAGVVRVEATSRGRRRRMLLGSRLGDGERDVAS